MNVETLKKKIPKESYKAHAVMSFCPSTIANCSSKSLLLVATEATCLSSTC